MHLPRRNAFKEISRIYYKTIYNSKDINPQKERIEMICLIETKQRASSQ